MVSAEAKKLLRLFKQYDSNGDGIIDRYELAEVLTELDAKWSDGDKIFKLFECLDTDDDGKVEMDEFVEWVMGANMAAWELMQQKPLTVLRLNGFGLYSRDEIMTALESLGEMIECHHVKGNFKESLVVYGSAEDAIQVFEALGGTLDEEQLAQEGMLKVRVKADTPLYKPGIDAFADSDQVICLTPRVFTSMEEKQACPDGFLGALSAFVYQHEVALGEDFGKVIGKVEELIDAGSADVPTVSKQLRLMSMNVQVKDAQMPEAAMWRRTVRMLARHELEYMDSSKMTDLLEEFNGFWASDAARPVSAAKTRATKRAKQMGVDDPWHVIGGCHRDNTALSALVAGA